MTSAQRTTQAEWDARVVDWDENVGEPDFVDARFAYNCRSVEANGISVLHQQCLWAKPPKYTKNVPNS